MVTVYWVPFLALTVHVEPFSAVIWPMSRWAYPSLVGAVAVGAPVVVGAALGLLDRPEHATTLIVRYGLARCEQAACNLIVGWGMTPL
jgi:hypothetical protein